MRNLIALAAGAATIALATSPALAEYPERPVTLLIGFAPGGATDTGARTLAPHLEKCIGGSVVVQNMPGASGEVAYAELARAATDGYMIGDIALPNVVTASITKDVPFAPDSYRYLGTLNSSNSTLSAPADRGWSTFDDVLQALRDSPQGLSVGLASLGSEDQLTLIQIANAADVSFNYIPFDGDAPAFNAMIGGHVDLVMSSSSATTQFADQVKPIAVAARERLATLPDTPTLTEVGYEIVAGSTHTIAAPAGLPDDIATKLADCITAISTDADYLAEAETRSLPVNFMSAEETQAFVEEQHALLKALWDEQPWFDN